MAAVIVSNEFPMLRAARADEQRFGATEVREREPAESEAFFRACAVRKMERSNSPGARTFWWLPVTKSTRGTRRGSPLLGQSVQMPSSAAVSEIIGPAGSDMQMFPPTVASFQILKEARNERQHWRNSGAAVHSGGAIDEMIEFDDLARGGDFKTLGRGWSEGQLSDSRSMSVCVLICGSENSQVPPASQAKPLCHCFTSSGLEGRLISVMVFRSIVNSTAPPDPHPAWNQALTISFAQRLWVSMTGFMSRVST